VPKPDQNLYLLVLFIAAVADTDMLWNKNDLSIEGQ
jgi:hypothetical protein